MTSATHKFWLKITAIVVGSFGPIFALGAMPQASWPASLSLDILSWPVDGNMPYDAPATHFLSALTGGFLLGWGVLIWKLSTLVYDKAPDETRKAVIAGLLSWFVLDSAGSVASGNWSNAGFNALILLIAAGPLWWPAKDLQET